MSYFTAIPKIIKDLLVCIGENPDREGLKDTPERVARALAKLLEGYEQDPQQILQSSFSTDGYEDMVILKDIDFYSTCEHHLLPFFGKAHVAYIPDKKVVGISKLSRLVDCFARRLQIQERMTHQIAWTINQILEPKGVGVVIEAQHLCMTSRGVEKQNAKMITNCMLGSFLNSQATRDEFLRAIK